MSKGTMIYLPSLAVSVGAGMYLLYSQIDDTIFSNFICSPNCLLGAEGRSDTSANVICNGSSLFILSLCFSPFFASYIPREILYVIAIQVRRDFI